jgi:hypothetical protein
VDTTTDVYHEGNIMLHTLFTTTAARLGVITTVAGLAVGLACVPAQAALTTDPVKITESGLDFGGGSLVFGVPTNSGVLGWDNTAGQITVILAGTLFINNGNGVCARMRLETYDVNHALVNARSDTTFCANDGSVNDFRVDLQTPADPDITHAHVILQEEHSNGSHTDIGTSYQNY